MKTVPMTAVFQMEKCVAAATVFPVIRIVFVTEPNILIQVPDVIMRKTAILALMTVRDIVFRVVFIISMPAVAAKYGVPYIAMHMKGDPKTMQSLTDYKRDITAEVVAYFEARVAALLAAGIAREHLVLDPGFGFAKTTEQNYELLAGLHRLCALGYPVLAGLSRKSMIYRVLGVTPAQSLAGTVALGWECLRQGAAILRVHDVREAVDTVRIFNAYVQNSGEICQMKK